MFFSTKDRDNDRADRRHCAVEEQGGWWYNKCSESNLTGRFSCSSKTERERMTWATWNSAEYALDSATMMIREYGIDVYIEKRR